ncbi:MAG: hypothetical protein ACRD6X_00550, partial [Pyrinomonadaceae bacterium]
TINAQSTTREPKNSEAKVLHQKVILEAKLNGDKFQSGMPVELTLKVRNKANLTVVLFDAEPTRGFDITIRDANGLNLPLTEEGKKRKYPINIVRRETVFLEPGKELILNNIRLDRLFDLTNAHGYTLTVGRNYYLQDIHGKNQFLEKDAFLTSSVKFNIK